MRPVRVVQVCVDDVVDVVAVWDRGMAAGRTVTMSPIMRTTIVPLRAGIWVPCAHRDRVLVEVIAVDVMKVAFVQVVAMAFVLDDRMPAALLVLMLVLLVNAMGVHASSFPVRGECIRPRRG
jgi:hypothetical protein